MVEGGLNRLFYGVGTTVAHIGMLKFCVDDIDTVGPGLLRGRQHTGIGFEIGVFRSERQDLQLVVEDERNTQIIERDNLRYQIWMTFGAEHGNVSAVRMAHKC